MKKNLFMQLCLIGAMILLGYNASALTKYIKLGGVDATTAGAGDSWATAYATIDFAFSHGGTDVRMGGGYYAAGGSSGSQIYTLPADLILTGSYDPLTGKYDPIGNITHIDFAGKSGFEGFSNYGGGATTRLEMSGLKLTNLQTNFSGQSAMVSLGVGTVASNAIIKFKDMVFDLNRQDIYMVPNKTGTNITIDISNSVFSNIYQYVQLASNNGNIRVTNCSFVGTSNYHVFGASNTGAVNFNANTGTRNTVVVTNSSFCANSTNGGGAAINAKLSTINITGCTFKNNFDTNFGGGAIFLGDNTQATVSKSVFYGNRSYTAYSSPYGTETSQNAEIIAYDAASSFNISTSYMQQPNAGAYTSYTNGANIHFGSPNTNIFNNNLSNGSAKIPTGCPSGLGDLVDTDNDGIRDVTDFDDDNDGITDAQEGGDTLDSDGDGVPNRIDLDSDNDGISDLFESGNTAAIAADTNGDGTITNAESPAGANGIPLVAEGGTEGGAVPGAKDTDSDGVKDFFDLDSDNDGINDVREGGNGALDTNNDGRVDGSDTDGDGIKDAVDSNDTAGSPIGGTPIPSTIPDTDGDGVKDFRDLDSDNDGINDVIEAGGSDPDGNGLPGTGSPAVGTTGIPTTGGGLTPPDSDGDGAPNYVDLDSDNDGKSDLIESGNAASIAADADNDGVIDFTNPATSDPDGDGIISAADGAPNVWGDNGGTAPGNTGPVTADAPDYINPKSDGTNDDIDSTPYSGLDANNDGVIDNASDPDKDGIANVVDTRPTTFGGLEAYALIFPKVIFQADYSIVLSAMKTDLAQNGYLPTSYLSVTRNDINTLTVNGKRVVDWVKVELRNPTSYAVLATRAALALSDGSIIDAANLQRISFTNASGNYILEVSHRNHMAVATRVTITRGKLLLVDYTLLTTVTTSQVTSGDKQMMWPGDVNSDGEVNATDISIMTADLDAGYFDGYFASDLNFDTEVNATDYSIQFVPFTIGVFFDFGDI